MKKSASVENLSSVQQEFASWRGSRAHKKVKIPAGLWHKAVSLCQDHKVSEVSRKLSLESGALYRELKKAKPRWKPKKSVFVSVPLGPPNVVTNPVVGSSLDCEWVRGDGARLRVQGLDPENIGKMVITFLQGAES